MAPRRKQRKGQQQKAQNNLAKNENKKEAQKEKASSRTTSIATDKDGIPLDMTQDTRSDDEILEMFSALYAAQNLEQERKQKENEIYERIMNTPYTDPQTPDRDQTLATENSTYSEPADEPFDYVIANKVRRFHTECEPFFNLFQELRHRHQEYAIFTNYLRNIRLVICPHSAVIERREKTESHFSLTPLSLEWDVVNTTSTSSSRSLPTTIHINSSPLNVTAFTYGLFNCPPEDNKKVPALWKTIIRWVALWMLPHLKEQNSNKTYTVPLNAIEIPYIQTDHANQRHARTITVTDNTKRSNSQLCSDYRTRWLSSFEISS